MPEKCCANCFFFVKVLSNGSDEFIKHPPEDERAAFKKINLEDLDNVESYKCWKGIWESTSYISEEFTKDTILKNRQRFIDDECFFLDKGNNKLTFKAANELVQRRKDNLKTRLQFLLTSLIVLTGIISIVLSIYG